MIKAPTEKCRVLIADDNRQVCSLLCDLLEPDGYSVKTAGDGHAALELVHSFGPDIVISDVVMPVMGGIELCRQIKANPKTSDIPVLLISGMRTAPEDALEGLTAGADDYLDVPFRNEEVLVKVARLAERRRVEKHYREIVEQAADIIYTRDMDGYITSINDAGAKFLGKPAQELIGSHLSELIGDDHARQEIEEARNISTDLSPRATYCLRDAEGNSRYLEGVVTLERDRNGISTAIRCVVRDVTEQKKAEEALRESEERYRKLVELSPEAIIVFREGKLLYAIQPRSGCGERRTPKIFWVDPCWRWCTPTTARPRRNELRLLRRRVPPAHS